MTDGTVIASGLNLRRSLTTGSVLRTLRRSSRVEILSEETWYRVRMRDGLEGYAFGDFIEKNLDSAHEVDTFDAEQPSPTVQPRLYRHERYTGNELTADIDFFPFLDRLAKYAASSDLKIYVTSSIRDLDTDVRGAIVKPAARSNHLVGHAIDFNLLSDSGRFFNSKKLAKLDQQPKYVQRFIERIRNDPELRWGGDFRKKDVVHVDDGLNVALPGLWDTKLASRAA